MSRRAPQIGDTVVLNLDTGLQQVVQNDLQAQILLDRKTPDVDDHNKLPPAINGAAIVMNPNNGQILAMASSPTYDLNEWVGGISSADYASLAASGAENNYAIQGEYTPGSTFKLITATADLQDGVYSPAQYYNDTGTFTVKPCNGAAAGCTFSDDLGDAGGEVNLPLALAISSDSYFYNLGELFWNGRSAYGDDAIQNVAAEYGEGQTTGIDLPDEGTGRVDSQPEREKLHNEDPAAYPNTSWYTGDNIEMAFGQGATALTPIEQAVAYATFANGGTRYAPQVASQIVNPTTGQVVKTMVPEVTGHVDLPRRRAQPHPPGPPGGHLQPQGDRLLGLRRVPDQLEFGRQDRHGDQSRGRRAQQLVRGLRPQPQSAVPGAGRDRRGRVRRRGRRPVGAQHLRLPLDQPGGRYGHDTHPLQPAHGRPPGEQPALRHAHDHHHRPGCDDRDRRGRHRHSRPPRTTTTPPGG